MEDATETNKNITKNSKSPSKSALIESMDDIEEASSDCSAERW